MSTLASPENNDLSTGVVPRLSTQAQTEASCVRSNPWFYAFEAYILPAFFWVHCNDGAQLISCVITRRVLVIEGWYKGYNSIVHEFMVLFALTAGAHNPLAARAFAHVFVFVWASAVGSCRARACPSCLTASRSWSASAWDEMLFTGNSIAIMVQLAVAFGIRIKCWLSFVLC